MAQDDLSDDQLRQLLEDASLRLRNARDSHENIVRPMGLSTSSIRKSLTSRVAATPLTPYIQSSSRGARLNPALLLDTNERPFSQAVRRVIDPITLKDEVLKAKEGSAGPDWYDLPKTILTAELKRDLQLLRMRSVLDPKRHFKKESTKTAVPEFSQVGTIVEGSTEFFSARLSNKERKRTFVEGLLADDNATHRFRSKYNEIQAAKTSGRKAHYKKIKAQRRRKTAKD